jgi:hypothetical protein
MKWIYPYPVLFGDVISRLLSVSVDGDPVPATLIDEHKQQVLLVDADRRDWSSLELQVEVHAPSSEIEDLEKANANPRALCVLQCGPSNSRISVPLSASALEPSRWIGSVELDRPNWFGRISLRGLVTAEVDGVANRIVGAAPDWTIRLDDQPVPPISGSITITWDDFTKPEHLESLRLYLDQPAFLQLDAGEPILYLNRAFAGLDALLQDRRRRNQAEQALHDQTRVIIASEAWSSLFNNAILAIEEDEDGNADWPEQQWQRTALEIAISTMYPERSADDALSEVAAARREAGVAAILQQQLLPAISDHVGMPRLLKRAIKTIGTDLEG